MFDTNIIIDIFLGDSILKEKIQSIKNPMISSVTVGELYYGAYNSNKPHKHIRQIEDFLSICQVVEVQKGTAIIYGEIKTQLRKNGIPNSGK